MTTGELALLITSISGAIAALITAIAALRSSSYNADRVKTLEKENERLAADLADKTQHNTHQDAILFDQHLKIEQYQRWGDRVGRMLNQMQLQLGSRAARPALDDTQPIKLPANKDWITGPLGPLDLKDVDPDQ